MIRPNLLAICLSLFVVFPMFLRTCDAFGRCNCEVQSRCGVLLDIKHPFRLKSDPKCCGAGRFELSCEHNHTLLHIKSKKYVVQAINHDRRTIHITNPDVQKDNCSTLLQALPKDPPYFFPSYQETNTVVLFVSCRSPVKTPFYVDTAPCITTKDFSNSSVYPREEHSSIYALIANDLVASDIEDSCSIYMRFPLVSQFLSSTTTNISFWDIHNEMASGFELSFYKPGRKISVLDLISLPIIISRLFLQVFIFQLLLRTTIGIPLLFVFLIYKCQRRHISIYDAIEEFLQTRNNLLPIRYSHNEIKKMTNNFKKKLGKGGYGEVYKGKSRSGNLVAIKVLDDTKGNGQDFINEVATIGRIHHVNVVQLVGFCANSSKRALVYDYMPNGSLDKFIFSDELDRSPLTWDRAYQIAVGVARGIEYLHQGCNMQILHFDIKPHNILLDVDFLPKISDFGLAKLYKKQDAAVTLTAARGTLGYMAPELIFRKIGEISFKADVYSFGQLLLAIAGKKKINEHANHSSRVYFPSWIYDRFDSGEDLDLDLGDITEEENKIIRKIILVALWCVQWTPADRPSMTEAREMLEGDLECLPWPPKPVFYPSDLPVREQSHSEDDEDSITLLDDSVILEIKQSD